MRISPYVRDGADAPSTRSRGTGALVRGVLITLAAVLGLWGGAPQTAFESGSAAGAGYPAFARALVEPAPGSAPAHTVIADSLPGFPACIRRGESSGGDPGRLDPGVTIARGYAADCCRCVGVVRLAHAGSGGRVACGGKGIRGPPRA